MSFKDKIDELLASAISSQLNEKKKMDPVGKADADIDNDGDVDSSDEYLHNRRKAIAKAMKKEASDEPITAQDIKMAIGIANDARYKDGNYTAAYNKIANMKKGLVSHPRVKDALRKANESVELDEVSAKLARKAAASSAAKSFEYGSSAYGPGADKEMDRLDKKADKARAHVQKRQGDKGVKKVDRMTGKLIYGRNESVEKDKQEGSCGTTNSSYMNASYLKAAAKASKKK